jgi:hypothetical protein
MENYCVPLEIAGAANSRVTQAAAIVGAAERGSTESRQRTREAIRMPVLNGGE